MSQRRQDARRAQQDRRRQERREQRVQQRRTRAEAAPAAPGTRAARVVPPIHTRRTRRPAWIAAGVAGGLLALAALAFVIWQQRKPLPGTHYESNGNEHVAPGQPHGAYFSNPPTSGWHFVDLPKPGIYSQPFPPEGLGHFMEHGGVWVLYTCESEPGKGSSAQGCPDLVQQLTDVVKQETDRNRPAALAPYPPAGYPLPPHRINLIAWQRLLSLDAFDKGAIEDFIERLTCRYNPEGGPYCAVTKGSAKGPAKDAGEGGFNAVTATAAPSGTPQPAGTGVPTPPSAPAATATGTAGAAAPTPPASAPTPAAVGPTLPPTPPTPPR